jgi:hypothetical protein
MFIRYMQLAILLDEDLNFKLNSYSHSLASAFK